jgi:uncharacterized protein YqiB (DUF1249 family)
MTKRSVCDWVSLVYDSNYRTISNLLIASSAATNTRSLSVSVSVYAVSVYAVGIGINRHYEMN